MLHQQQREIVAALLAINMFRSLIVTLLVQNHLIMEFLLVR